MTDLKDFARLVARDHGLCVMSTLRPDSTIQSSLVNAGVLDHPVTGKPVVGLVARGQTRKLANLRARPRTTVVVRAGWEWVAVEGPVELAGPDDRFGDMDAERIRLLLREIFTACGGTHDDWDTYDRVMAEERRTAVLVAPRARLFRRLTRPGRPAGGQTSSSAARSASTIRAIFPRVCPFSTSRCASAAFCQ